MSRADCTDCAWSFTAPDAEEVADQLEAHAQKELHHVRFHR